MCVRVVIQRVVLFPFLSAVAVATRHPVGAAAMCMQNTTTDSDERRRVSLLFHFLFLDRRCRRWNSEEMRIDWWRLKVDGMLVAVRSLASLSWTTI